MSSRQRQPLPPTGTNAHYRALPDFIADKKRIEAIADKIQVSKRHIARDSCDQWTLYGRSAHVQTADDSKYLLFVATYSPRKWSAISRGAKTFGWEISQDGDQEGCLLLEMPADQTEAKFMRKLLGLKKLGLRSRKTRSNEGVSGIQQPTFVDSEFVKLNDPLPLYVSRGPS